MTEPRQPVKALISTRPLLRTVLFLTRLDRLVDAVHDRLPAPSAPVPARLHRRRSGPQ